MSDVTRTPGSVSAGPRTPDTRGETTPGTGRAPAPHRPAAAAEGTAGARLLPHEESDKLGQRLHHAVAGFVDEPRAAVEEADRALEEIAARLTDAVNRRHHTLRASWQGSGGPAATTDTEQLRLVLRDYRALADRLLRI
ncbi:hypothetical protein TU94_10075 [Streptomyces cyaneogriseus subsp. noncyanogenus]|uniref:Uncharacterized protein n=1 Tax=Streptomyces cyaneogriseus subsp. noncyanogenus TaxID=477245 RepID=A0A0C5GC62_9ACTN|nr:hypothetical protein TU94_10075 [Streptomyces cyaneogriseus subsp. noncyanogenus]